MISWSPPPNPLRDRCTALALRAAPERLGPLVKGKRGQVREPPGLRRLGDLVRARSLLGDRRVTTSDRGKGGGEFVHGVSGGIPIARFGVRDFLRFPFSPLPLPTLRG